MSMCSSGRLRAMLRVLVPLVAWSFPSALHAQPLPTVTPTPGILESISISPQTSAISVGQFENYTTTGHYAGGATKNLTQKVTYTSSNPAVAVATNSTIEGQSKSRVEGVGTGTVTISAMDPVT